jgi:hypothetical protein
LLFAIILSSVFEESPELLGSRRYYMKKHIRQSPSRNGYFIQCQVEDPGLERGHAKILTDEIY